MSQQVNGQVRLSKQRILKQARELWSQGRKNEAFSLLINVANDIDGNKKPAWLYQLLAFYQYNYNDLPSALSVIQSSLEFYPDDPALLEANLMLNSMLGHVNEAKSAFETLMQHNISNANIYDGASSIYKKLGELEKAKEYGLKSLAEKDRQVCEAADFKAIRKRSAKAHLKQRPDAQNYISFSLFGDRPKYLRGVFDNYLAIEKYFPGWQMVIFVDDTVPEDMLNEIKKLKIEVVHEPSGQSSMDKLVWRFKPLDWDKSGRVLIRDVDSVITKKEAELIDQWIESDELFHIIRDWYSHSELILAGLWGGVAGILPVLQELQGEYVEKEMSFSHYDQYLLRATVWPRIKKKVFVHDEVFQYAASVKPHNREDWSGKNHFGCIVYGCDVEAQAERIAKFSHIKSLAL